VAFALETLLLLLQLHRARALEGPVLNLGRQTVHGSHQEILNAFSQAGVQPAPLPDEILLAVEQGRVQHRDRIFFAHLGLELSALDVSEYEGAEIVHDLNLPIPSYLHGRFKTVIDGGTCEHVFDVRAAFRNIADLLAPGGLAIHLSPTNNYVNHGFWQLSPRSFYDYYHVNGFEDLQTTMVVSPRDDDKARAWATFPFDPLGPQGAVSFFSSPNDRLTCVFRARKTSESTSERIPSQSFENATSGGTPLVGSSIGLELTAEGLIVKGLD
jgi:SAM-dependent methyltransferase